MQVLLYAQLRDNSNNMVKVITGGLDKLTDEASPEIQQQTSISAIINGHHSAGIVVMKEALQLLCLLLCAAQAHYLVPLTRVIPLSSYPSPTVHTDHQALSRNSDRGTQTYHTEPLHTHANKF